jgi:hypothetical protein
MYRKTLVFSGSLNTLMVAANAPEADGTIATAAGVGIQGLDNPTCGASSATQHMWALTPITRAAAGLPATIVTPLSIQ